ILDLLEGLVIEQGEAFQNTTNDRAGLARHRLVGFPAESLDLQRHVTRLLEARVRRIDKRFKGWCRAREVREQTIIDFAVLFLPEAAAFLQNPEAGRLLRVMYRTTVA